MQRYNEEHRHSAINFVTPAERHVGLDRALLEKRAIAYEAATLERDHTKLADGSRCAPESGSTHRRNDEKMEVVLELKMAA